MDREHRLETDRALERRHDLALLEILVREVRAGEGRELDVDTVTCVAGRNHWAPLRHYVRERRMQFTNKEIRLDPTLELPEFRDNLDSRLIPLQRRLDERDAPIRIEKTGRGSFHLAVDGTLRLDEVAAPPT